MRTPLLTLPLALALSACGNIGLGEDLDRVTTTPDGGVGQIGGNPQDASIGGGQPPPDCTPREVPTPPTAWPFVRSKASYLAEFGGIPMRATSCGISACHGGGTNAPFIPATDAELDDPAVLTRAIEAAWTAALPQEFPGQAQPIPPLLYMHVTGKGGLGPAYQAAQETFIGGFVKKGSDCAWKPVIAAGAGANDDPALCPLPTLDLSYCLP